MEATSAIWEYLKTLNDNDLLDARVAKLEAKEEALSVKYYSLRNRIECATTETETEKDLMRKSMKAIADEITDINRLLNEYYS